MDPFNIIFLNNILDVLHIHVTIREASNIQYLYPEIRRVMGIEHMNTIEILKIDDTMRISILSYADLPDDAKPAKVLEFLNSATVLRHHRLLSEVHTDDSQAVHLIVDYPREIRISYAAYIAEQLNHRSSIVISNKVDVSTLRRMIAKDLERKEDILQLFSAWDGFLTGNNEFPATLTVVDRIPLLDHTILSDVLPLKIKRHIDVIVYVGDPQPNASIANTNIPAMPTPAQELLLLLEEQEFTRRAHEEANRRVAEKVGQLRGLVASETSGRRGAERKRFEEEQRKQVQGEWELPSKGGSAMLMKQDKLEIRREGGLETLMKQDKLETRREEETFMEQVTKALWGNEKEVEGESCKPRKALDIMDILKAMMDEQRRKTDQQTELLTGMLAEQRQHSQNVESLLQQLIWKV